MTSGKIPLLEFDSEKGACINPSDFKRDLREPMPECCVISFFREISQKLIKEGKAKILYEFETEAGKHVVYVMEHDGKKIAFFSPGVGAPIASYLFEDAIARGSRFFIACGSCGKIDTSIKEHLFIPVEAVRDEGVSYHYMPPSRTAKTNSEMVNLLDKTLTIKNVPFKKIKTWTNSAFYRETPKKIQDRIIEGCSVVEMECAAFIAVAKFRKVKFGQLLYSSDEVRPEEWTGWIRENHSLREETFWLAVEAVSSIKNKH